MFKLPYYSIGKAALSWLLLLFEGSLIIRFVREFKYIILSNNEISKIQLQSY